MDSATTTPQSPAQRVISDWQRLWQQVQRTISGEALPQQQIAMIVKAVLDGLELSGTDDLLDLCCGNGALSAFLHPQCRSLHGVDISAELVAEANSLFQGTATAQFETADITTFIAEHPTPLRYNKAVCYGAFMYLAHHQAEQALRGLRDRFARLDRVYIGNLPDKARMHAFFRPGIYHPGLEDDHTAPLGVWRTEQEFHELARAAGWRSRVLHMPEDYVAAHYRYDVVLEPA